MIVLDASVAASWLLAERPLPIGMELVASNPDTAIVVPGHWPVEICNMLRTHLQSGRLSIADFHTIMDRFDLMTIRIQPPVDLDEIGPLAQFAVANDLTAYDAAYVQLALQRQATLATLDRAMRRAATKLSIPLLPAQS